MENKKSPEDNFLISVLIVTRNRRNALAKTLDNFLAQSYKNIEIIVADNNSIDLDKNELLEKYPQVKFIFLPANVSMQAFDFALAESRGEIIWRTDDDSNPRDPDTFSKVVQIFSAYPNIDIIATDIQEPLYNNIVTEWYPHKVDKESVPANGYLSNTFLGGGAAIRRKVFDTIGTFWGFGFEELDFSTRAILSGFQIRYYPNIITDHYVSKDNRNRTQRLILMAMQQVRYHAKYMPPCRSFGRLILLMIFQNLELLSIKFSCKLICELNSGMIHFYRHARNFERVKVPKDKLKEITLEENMFLSIIRYFQIRLRRFLFRKKA